MYVISTSLDTDEPIMLINQPIGYSPSDGGGYIDGALFQQELLELDNMGKKRILIHINSVGGNVMEGYSICGAILKSKTPVDTICVGIAASMAGAIFMCGRKRIMMDYSTLMVHNPFGGSDKKQLNSMRESLCTMISAKCSISKEQVAYLMDRETWISAAECFEKGFCTDIEVTEQANQKRMPLAFAGVRAMWEEANLIHNNILNTFQMDTPTSRANGLSLIANFLELNVDATENSILSEVKARINKATMARSEMEDTISRMKKDMDAAANTYKELKTKYDDMLDAASRAEAKAKKDKEEAEATAKIESDKAAAKIKAAEEETKKVAATAMVDTYVASRRIKVEAKADWIDTAIKLGINEAKALIEGTPLNQTAVATVVSNKDAAGNAVVDPNKEAASSMSYMARVQADIRNRKKSAVNATA